MAKYHPPTNGRLKPSLLARLEDLGGTACLRGTIAEFKLLLDTRSSHHKRIDGQVPYNLLLVVSPPPSLSTKYHFTPSMLTQPSP